MHVVNQNIAAEYATRYSQVKVYIALATFDSAVENMPHYKM